MEMIISNFLAIVILNLGSAEYVEVLANTFTSILNQNYTEDVVFARSKIECTKLCLTTPYCEAIYYSKTADDSKCFLRKCTPNILYPLIIGTLLPSNPSWMFLRKHEEYREVPSGYQFESNLRFWYKLIKTPKLNVTDAREACRQDKAYLILIDDHNHFTRKLLDEHNVVTAYIQGVRATENQDYLDDIERPMNITDKQWGNGGVGGPGNYLRFQETWIETSRGTWENPYICQLRLN